jgi:hypothetical protein
MEYTNIFAMQKASKVFEYFYSQALTEFGAENAKKLAQIPADYVYNQLLINFPDNCYINSECCLEYCNDVLDKDFKAISPETRKKAYEKAYNVSVGGLTAGEMDLRLKVKRRSTGPAKKYLDTLKLFRTQREDDISSLMENVSIKRRPDRDMNIDFKKLKL